MFVLKGTHPVEGQVEQLFTVNERDAALGVGRAWLSAGWRPRLLFKSWDGRFSWLTSQLGQLKLAA